MGEGSLSPSGETITPRQALFRILEDCGARSLGTIYQHLRVNIQSPVLREATDDVVRVTLQQISQIVGALMDLEEECYGTAV